MDREREKREKKERKNDKQTAREIPFFRRRCPDLLQYVIHKEITLPHVPVHSIPS